MKDKSLLKNSLRKLMQADSLSEVDELLEEIVPELKKAGISIPELLILLKTGGGSGVEVRSQDHRNTITNSNKAQSIIEKLIQKMKK
jgi:hypothetical protein